MAFHSSAFIFSLAHCHRVRLYNNFNMIAAYTYIRDFYEIKRNRTTARDARVSFEFRIILRLNTFFEWYQHINGLYVYQWQKRVFEYTSTDYNHMQIHPYIFVCISSSSSSTEGCFNVLMLPLKCNTFFFCLNCINKLPTFSITIENCASFNHLYCIYCEGV